MYYVVSNSEGDTFVEAVSEKILKERLTEKYYGDVGFDINLSLNSDTNFWGNNILIIKGDIVIPEPVQTVTEYKL